MTITCPFCNKDDRVVVAENPTRSVRYWSIVAINADSKVISIDESSEKMAWRRHRPHQLRCIACKVSFQIPNGYVVHFIQDEDIPFGGEEEDENPSLGKDV